ncbi:MAG: F0F1 ATP synthase subunit A [Chloroflexi bacterium]|nr:F0F1 ATP synthase subunit A [Chloroflexota bacterium]
MAIEELFPKILFYIGGVGIRDTVLHTWIVILFLGGFAVWASRRVRIWQPETWQLAVEYLVEYVEGLIANMAGRDLPILTPYLTTMITLIAIANLLGLLPGFMAPTRDLNTTAALSLISLASCQYFGIRKRGLWRHLHALAEPVALMLPLNLLSEVSRTISMALRLFGNVLAGEVITGVMFLLVPVLAPLPLSLLGMITGVLQALVFTVLTLVFVADALGEEEAESI